MSDAYDYLKSETTPVPDYLDTATNTTTYLDYPGSLGVSYTTEGQFVPTTLDPLDYTVIPQDNEVEKLKLEIIKLKARLYDLEHDADRSVK